ncbi:MAG: hypothetical protein ACFCU3_03840 [Verrucomicrobiales bacterium]
MSRLSFIFLLSFLWSAVGTPGEDTTPTRVYFEDTDSSRYHRWNPPAPTSSPSQSTASSPTRNPLLTIVWQDIEFRYNSQTLKISLPREFSQSWQVREPQPYHFHIRHRSWEESFLVADYKHGLFVVDGVFGNYTKASWQTRQYVHKLTDTIPAGGGNFGFWTVLPATLTYIGRFSLNDSAEWRVVQPAEDTFQFYNIRWPKEQTLLINAEDRLAYFLNTELGQLPARLPAILQNVGVRIGDMRASARPSQPPPQKIPVWRPPQFKAPHAPK